MTGLIGNATFAGMNSARPMNMDFICKHAGSGWIEMAGSSAI